MNQLAVFQNEISLVDSKLKQMNNFAPIQSLIVEPLKFSEVGNSFAAVAKGNRSGGGG